MLVKRKFSGKSLISSEKLELSFISNYRRLVLASVGLNVRITNVSRCHVFMGIWGCYFFACHLFVHQGELSTGRYIPEITNSGERRRGYRSLLLPSSLLSPGSVLLLFATYPIFRIPLSGGYSSRRPWRDTMRPTMRPLQLCGRCNYVGTPVPTLRSHRLWLCRVLVITFLLHDALTHDTS